jgi:hypothetical protein
MSNPVTRLEQFIVDVLVSSPHVPLGVNVMRLADTLDKEGVVQSSSNIIVSYKGGSSNIKNREPLVFEKSYIFSITFNCQDYLTTSAHDFALHLVDAASRSLTNKVPFVDGVQVIEPFYSSDETFEGITENSQYVYSQTWRLLSEEIYTDTSLDPCVRRGNCKAVWPPQGVVGSVPPGSMVTSDGTLWEICAETSDGNVLCGTTYNSDGDLVLQADGSILIPREELGSWTLKTTNYVTNDGKLEVWLHDGDGNQVEQIFYTDTGKKVARMALELWRSRIDGVARCDSSLSCKFQRDIQTQNLAYAVVDTICAPLYTNPLTSDEAVDLRGGSLIAVNPEVRLYAPNDAGEQVAFVQVVKSDLGSGGWVEEAALSQTVEQLVQDGASKDPAAEIYREEVEATYDASNETSTLSVSDITESTGATSPLSSSGTTDTTRITTGSNPGNDKQVGRSRYDGSRGEEPNGS